ncbi:Uncharacterized protein Fot_18998 [Forsythia ovata]|uniref:Uncharacterized protein n=1 Tax=Forsythia ovata TaxID=205694 RepID=A0ABD1VK75_9LAMI
MERPYCTEALLIYYQQMMAMACATETSMAALISSKPNPNLKAYIFPNSISGSEIRYKKNNILSSTKKVKDKMISTCRSQAQKAKIRKDQHSSEFHQITRA